MLIKKLKAKKIQNSKKEDAIKIILKTDNGKFEASAPSGTSKGKYEVIDIPAEGIKTSIDFANKTLNKELKNFEINSFNDLELLEDLLKQYDPSGNWEKIGGNLVIALEFAILKALSKNNIWKFLNKDAKQVPRPLGNVIGGGQHTKIKNPVDFQEFLLISTNATNFAKANQANIKIHELAEKEIRNKNKGFHGEINYEGAWASSLSIYENLDILRMLCNNVSRDFGFDIRIGLDIAASSFFDGEYYNYKNFSDKEKIKKLTKEEQIKFIIDLVKEYDIYYIEDPLQEEDFEGFAELKKQLKNCIVCGDDLIATNPERLKKALKLKSINAVLIKPNQAGSLIKTKQVIDLAKENKIFTVMSHRSGETLDATISQLAVGFNCPIIKCGIYGKERIAKFDEIKKIEQQIKYNVVQ